MNILTTIIFEIKFLAPGIYVSLKNKSILATLFRSSREKIEKADKKEDDKEEPSLERGARGRATA